MQLLDAGKGEHGCTVMADTQTAGRGQRGNSWADTPGESLLMSIILDPGNWASDPYICNCAVSVAIANVLQMLCIGHNIAIKWPNDLIINDKKAGGILIQNIWRGAKWSHCIVGIGINVLQGALPESLPHATSIYLATKNKIEPYVLCRYLQKEILAQVQLPENDTIKRFNELLFKKGSWHPFRSEAGETVLYKIQEVDHQGYLHLLTQNNELKRFQHGEINWVWP